MNDLEQWLADVRDFNGAANIFNKDGAALVAKRDVIEVHGRAYGLKRSKIKSMLARVKLKVEMPREKNVQDG